jgi:hypothetical protein
MTCDPDSCDYDEYCGEGRDPCERESHDIDILTGRALCLSCGHAWWLTSEELRAELAWHAQQCQSISGESEPKPSGSSKEMKSQTTADAAIDTISEGKQRKAFKALVRIFGDDTSTLLNELHAMSARLAILSGVSREDFAAGIKYHWDFIANIINEESTLQ